MIFKFDDYVFEVCYVAHEVMSFDIDGHTHDKYGYELHYITDGLGTLVLKNKSEELFEGCFYITGPGIYHRQITNKDFLMKEICIHIEILEMGKNPLLEPFVSNHYYFGSASDEAVNCLNQICNINKKNFAGKELEMQAYFQILLIEISKMYLPAIQNENSQNQNRSRIIDNAFLFHSDTITLDSIADELGICQRQVQRIIKECYDCNFSQKKRSGQIEMSLDMLKASESIANIAQRCGFCDSSAFSKAFKAEKGVTPKEYRSSLTK